MKQTWINAGNRDLGFCVVERKAREKEGVLGRGQEIWLDWICGKRFEGDDEEGRWRKGRGWREIPQKTLQSGT